MSRGPAEPTRTWSATTAPRVLPARVRRPRDKVELEVAVQVVERWVLARLRHRRFLSLAKLNGAIRELVTDLNDRPMRHLATNRRALFETLERSHTCFCRRSLMPTPTGGAAGRDLTTMSKFAGISIPCPIG